MRVLCCVMSWLLWLFGVLRVVLFGVLRGGGVVWCVGVFSLSLSLSLFLSILFFLCLALSLSFLFFPSSVLSSSFSSLFFLFLFYLLSSLLANKHCVKHSSTNVTSNFEAFACDLEHGRCTTVASQFTASLPPPFPFQRTKKKEELFITGIFPAMNFIFITV